MSIFDNEIFYLLKIEKRKKIIHKNFELMIVRLIDLFLKLLIITLFAFTKMVSHLRLRNDYDIEKKIWFVTGGKSFKYFKKYKNIFDRDIYPLYNRYFGKYGLWKYQKDVQIELGVSKYFKFSSESIHSLLNTEQLSYRYLIKYHFKSFGLALVYSVINYVDFELIILTEKESSWGQLIYETAKERNVEVIVIPHGVEYNFKLPNGYPGDKFYTTTFKAATELNKVYNTDKFIFDKNISKHVMQLTTTKNVNAKNVVYFPEGRNVSIDQNILGELIEKGVEPLLCIHPLDKDSNYSKFNLKVIPFDKAIKNSIVISRNSTVLLEGLAYKSFPISIICNDEDERIKNSIPSLNIIEIHTVNSVQKLIDLLKKIDRNKEYSRKQLDRVID